jgi:beta-glucosidase
MAGVLQNETEARACVRALAAGCDLLLYPEGLEAVAEAIGVALESGELRQQALEQSLARRRQWSEWADLREPPVGARQPLEWAGEIACRVVHKLHGEFPPLRERIQLTVVDDDIGGPYPPPSREPFPERLRELGIEVAESNGGADAGAVHVIALFGDVRAWKGRPGYSAEALRRVREAVASNEAGRTVLIQFSHPRLAGQLDTTPATVCAWGGEAPMQRAAAEWLVSRCRSN